MWRLIKPRRPAYRRISVSRRRAVPAGPPTRSSNSTPAPNNPTCSRPPHCPPSPLPPALTSLPGAEGQPVWAQWRQRALTGRTGMVTNGAFWGAGRIAAPNPDPAYPDVKGYGVQNTLYSGVLVPPQLTAPPTTQPNPYAYFE